jgi:hypothetical protein
MIRTIVNRLVNKNTRENPRIQGMELTGDILIGAPREKVWAGLNDTEILARCIPGCESMEATSPTERTARVAVKMGPVRARFVGNVRMEDIRPNEGCVLRCQVGGRMIDAASKQMADQFFTAFNAQMVGVPEADVAQALPAGTEHASGAAAAVSPAPSPRAASAPQSAVGGEGVRVLWFVLGALSTGFGAWIASLLTS